MLSFNWMASITAVIYFLGIYLHYVHVLTIFYLSNRYEEINHTKSIVMSVFWPYHTVVTALEALFMPDDDEDD